MKKSFVIPFFVSICILFACTNEHNSNSTSPGTTSSQENKIAVSDSLTKNESAKPASNYIFNMDELELYGTTQTSTKQYTETDLQKMSEDEVHKDYLKVVSQFVEGELGKKVYILDSVDGAHHPKEVTVIVTDGTIYRVFLEKRYDYNGIWTVTRYSEYKDEWTMPLPQDVEYRIVNDLSSIPDEVRKEVRERINSKSDEISFIHDPYNDAENTYALVVAPQGYSADLLNVHGKESYINILYTTFETVVSSDGKTTTAMFGENPFILIEVTDPIVDIFFRKYTSINEERIRLNMP